MDRDTLSPVYSVMLYAHDVEGSYTYLQPLEYYSSSTLRFNVYVS